MSEVIARMGLMNTVVLCSTMGFLSIALQGCGDDDNNSQKPKWLDRCRQSDPRIGCIVNGRDDLPSVAMGSTFDVSFATNDVGGGGNFAKAFSLKHSALIIREVASESPMKIVVEYVARHLEQAVLPPSIDAHGDIQWQNEGIVDWYPEANLTDWLAKAHVISIGSVTGSVLDNWFEWIPSWREQHQGYQYWSVWNDPDITKKESFLADSICHTFTEDGLNKLFEFGASFHQQELLCRNYFPFITDSTPRPMDMHDKADADTVVGFYRGLGETYRSSSNSTQAFVGQLLKFVKNLQDHVVIYEYTSTEQYFDVKVVEPYVGFATNPQYLYQRMPLRWQHDAAKLGECSLGAQGGTAAVLV